MKRSLIILMSLFSFTCFAQETWYGEIAYYNGGGVNDIYRFKELTGAPSFTGNGFFTAGLSVRRFINDWFSIEGGLNYSGNWYTKSSAPLPEVYTSKGYVNMISAPVKVRFDFLKYLFADMGIVPGFQSGQNGSFDISGVGATAGIGLKYRFKSDIIVTVRAFQTQYSIFSFSGDDYPYTMSNNGITAGIGYRFIRLGKCHCPEAKGPRRKFF